MLKDLRHALRVLLRSPGFTALSVLTLAVGIGASTAVFGLRDALLFRQLPYAAPERLVVPQLTRSEHGKPAEPLPVWSYAKYQVLLANQDLYEGVAGYRDVEVPSP